MKNLQPVFLREIPNSLENRTTPQNAQLTESIKWYDERTRAYLYITEELSTIPLDTLKNYPELESVTRAVHTFLLWVHETIPEFEKKILALNLKGNDSIHIVSDNFWRTYPDVHRYIAGRIHLPAVLSWQERLESFLGLFETHPFANTLAGMGSLVISIKEINQNLEWFEPHIRKTIEAFRFLHDHLNPLAEKSDNIASARPSELTGVMYAKELAQLHKQMRYCILPILRNVIGQLREHYKKCSPNIALYTTIESLETLQTNLSRYTQSQSL